MPDPARVACSDDEPPLAGGHEPVVRGWSGLSGTTCDHTSVKGSLAGVLAALTWAVAEPTLGRVFGTPYSDVKLMGGLVTTGRRRDAAGLAIHVANGAAFGWAFERVLRGGVRRGLLAAQVENALFWPGMAVIDRIHPDRRSGAWPPLATSPRVAGYEVTAHALFGAVLGALTR